MGRCRARRVQKKSEGLFVYIASFHISGFLSDAYSQDGEGFVISTVDISYFRELVKRMVIHILALEYQRAMISITLLMEIDQMFQLSELFLG